ncbi:MAG: DUF1848 domain-containing protein [Deltaproteobacteria bacterium]|nr:DUF1848 domain-containing protein [Deltaproteobacteria bacterium]
MHIISASRRTDIPALHAAWFMNRIRAGRVRVISPFGPRVFEISLLTEDVLGIVFWTKNAAPLLKYLDELRNRGYCFSFLYTVNNYPAFLEPGTPKLGHTMKIVETLAKKLGPRGLRWRYDTIVMTEKLDRSWHTSNFRNLCASLAGFTSECIFSFCDYYRKTKRNMSLRVPDHIKPSEAECRDMAEELAHIARDRKISLLSCAHDFLVSERIGKARCIDAEAMAHVVDSTRRQEALRRLKTAPSRNGCGCAASKDIGAYDTCAQGCVYCYANSNPDRARRNLALVRADSECLDPRWDFMNR